MKRAHSAAFAAILLALSAETALAACTEFPEPGVNWRRCYHDGRDLTGVNLEGAMLRDATFQRSAMKGANLSQVDGYRAKFVSATMTGVKFDQARLIEADLTRVDLTGASLVETDLRNAKLVNAILRDTNLTSARIDGTDFRNADLSGATWIDGSRKCAEQSIGQCN
ncbi:uncharacterized protein YjbI with pentapeptide repeats [Skermanella aerolata]|jgi:uncharacterized protein YjbI with pentapeptide repeats|uniref:Pentapeptide repeat-containing protein n=1 Tax=Skermanella aerolata TaxID=393310 RepID=A0A512DSQ5_9PROT|nr:pentapeptide repeat-containing protein [Skermanella aerolata]KJB96052.1 hypothetical protein N826_37880 [Skermanella aerolata KACC 11604]GEO39509.1 hypothetical protein SAE02_36570 [Skermanella aerolata]